MDSNPFKSPPLEILGEGFPTVVQYLRVRMKRIAVMHYLILERQAWISSQEGCKAFHDFLLAEHRECVDVRNSC